MTIDLMLDFGSAWRGLRAMSSRREFFRHWHLRWMPRHPGFWCHLWTPIWHEGRGPYLTLGLGAIAVLRGYYSHPRLEVGKLYEVEKDESGWYFADLNPQDRDLYYVEGDAVFPDEAEEVPDE